MVGGGTKLLLTPSSLNSRLHRLFAMLSPSPVDGCSGSGFSPAFNTIREGYLHVKVRSRLRTSWQKVWCVLRRHPGAGLGAVQFAQYKTPVDAAQDLGCCARLDMSTATFVGATPESRKKNSFTVECTHAALLRAQHVSLRSTTFHFHGSTVEESEVWIACLLEYAPSVRQGESNTFKHRTGSLPDLSSLGRAPSPAMRPDSLSSLDINGLYEPSAATFPVEFDGSPLIPFQGACTLTVTAEALVLTDSFNLRSIEWPLQSLRDFGIRKEQFHFNSGRSCTTGPAKFVFHTSGNVAETIAARVKVVSETMAGKSLVESTSSGSTQGSPRGLDSRGISSLVHRPPAEQPTRPVLVRSSSDNSLDSSTLEGSITSPYSVTRIRNSWLILRDNQRPAQIDTAIEYDEVEDEDDIGELTVFSGETRCTQVKIRTKSEPAAPPPTIARYETITRRYAEPVVKREPTGKISSPDVKYSQPTSAKLRQGPPSGKPLYPLLLTQELADSLDVSLEASAQAALRRRYSPIFVASRDHSPQSSRGTPSLSSRCSPMASQHGSPCLGTSPVASPASGHCSAGMSPLTTGPCSPLSETSLESELAYDQLASGRSSQAGPGPDVDDAGYASPELSRPRSFSAPQSQRLSTNAEYDHLDHDSARVIDGYARLAHPPPDRPAKPPQSTEGYSHLNSCPTGADPMPAGGSAFSTLATGLSRRPARRVTKEDVHRVRASSDSTKKNMIVRQRVAHAVNG